MANTKNSRLVLIIIFLGLFLVSIYIYNSTFPEEKTTDTKKESRQLLNDYSRFFTINSCVYKYIVYLQSNDTESLMKVIDKKYITENNLNTGNVLEKIGKLDGNHSFKLKKVYYENIDENNFKYYVYGDLYKESIDNLEKLEDKYYIVYMDNEKQLFSIAPYDGKIFKEESK